MLHRTDNHGARGRPVLAILGCLGLLVLGTLLGRSLSPDGGGSVVVDGAPVAVRTITAPPIVSTTDGEVAPGTFSRSREGAAAAAGGDLVALGGSAILDPAALDAAIRRIASRQAQPALRSAYATASSNIREQFGLAGQPSPIVILRSIPLAYRVDSFTISRAVISIWDLGIVGSGASVDPQASWRTETITLLWEDGTWKASDFKSVAGPIPALAGRDQPSSPAELFAFVPTLAEYTRVAP